MQRYLNAHTAFLLAALATLIFLQLGSVADDPGIGWHLLNGKLILETGEIPTSDPFLQTKRAWISDQWLGDLLLYLFYSLGSWPLLYAVAIVAYLAIFFLIAARFFSNSEFPALAVGLASFISFKLGLVHFIIRPVLLSLLIFAIVFYQLLGLYHLITRKRDFDAFKKRIPKLFILFPLLFILWANIHPSFALGLFLLACFIAALVLDKFCAGAIFPSAITSAAVLLFLLCAVATVFNPYQLELHHSILSLANSDYFLGLNNEWKALNVRATHGKLFEICIALLVVIGFLFSQAFKQWRFFELLTLLSFAHFALHSERMLTYFAVCLTAFLAEALTPLCLFLKLGSKHRGAALVFVALAALILGFGCYAKIPGYAGEFGPGSAKYPYAALKFLTKEDSSTKVIYSTPNWGGFISWFSEGKLKAVLDDRNTMLGEQAYKDYFKVINLNPEWRSIVKASGARYLLFEKRKAIVNYLKLQNSPIFEDELSVLFDLGT